MAILEAIVIVALVAMLSLGIAAATGISPDGGRTLAANNRGATAPTLELSMGSNTLRVAGGSLTVQGRNFTPSAGGQQVYLWVGYPGDYCSADFSKCHGFYAYPWVNADGTFDVTYANVLLQSGTGVVSAHQWNVKTGKWQTVAGETYTVN